MAAYKVLAAALFAAASACDFTTAPPIGKAYTGARWKVAGPAERGAEDAGEDVAEAFSPIPAPLGDRPEQLLGRAGYTVSYNSGLKLPNWVAWTLTEERTKGRNKRDGEQFAEDTEVPAPRADTWDYYSSGYDRGHMCPAADNKWDAEAMRQSFLLTNVCPQNPNLNRGDWNELEIACRRWAAKYGEVHVVAGPVMLRSGRKTIGKHRVAVPDAFFKVVLRLSPEPAAIGFIYRNTDGNRPKDSYVNSVDDVERITGMDFFPSLPDGLEERVEARADYGEWE